MSGLGGRGEDSPSKRSAHSLSRAQDATLGALSDHPHGIDTAASPSKSARLHRSPLLLSPRDAPDPEIYNKLSGTAQKHLDAQFLDRFIKEVQADDHLADVAYRRGLLVNFVIYTLPGNQRPLQIEAPEFASVAYLKRCIFKYKLLNNGFCPLERFDLRKRNNADVAGTSNDQIPLHEDTLGIPTLLVDLGFFAGNTYELSIISHPQPAIEEPEERLKLQGVAYYSPTKVIPSENPNVRKYQELLQGTQLAGNFAPPLIEGASPGAGIPIPRGAPNTAGVAGASPRPGALQSPATAGEGSDAPGRSPRQLRAGRWSAEEVEALVWGVQAFGPIWSTIWHNLGGRGIDSRRTPVDLKDKWRNLVKLSSDPSKQTRSIGLTDQLKATILRLANTPTDRENSVAGSVLDIQPPAP